MGDDLDEIYSRIPEPERCLFFVKCPRCGHRTWNCHGAEYVGYQGHYMGHLIADLKAEAAAR